MALDRRSQRAPFDAQSFTNDLTTLLSRHGLLAISANISVPLDRHTNHVMRAEAGVTQLEIDILEHEIRRRAPVTGGL